MTAVPGPPGRSAGDYGHGLVRAVLSSIPGVGGASAEVFAMVVAPPMEKRRDEWMKAIADAINELVAKVDGITPEGLAENEGFATTLIHASQIAFRNHQQEKLDALRNAVQNSALPEAPDDDIQQIFVNLVDRLTPSHLRILKLLENPPLWFQRNGVSWPNLMVGGVHSLIQAAYPELAANRELVNLIARDLYDTGLSGTNNYGVTVSGAGLRESHTTPFGHQFIAFVEKQI